MSEKILLEKRIGVLLGGDSSERKVSLKSGTAIYQALKAIGLDVVKLDVKKNPSEMIKKAGIDMAFIALHGHGGEDGTIQEILEDLQIPYTGSDPYGSLNAFDKVKTKMLFEKNRISMPRYQVITAADWKEKVALLKFPLFIKPVDNGSSIGVHMVSTIDDLEKKLAAVFLSHDRYLAEERIVGREITVGILGDKALPIVELKPKNDFYDFRAKYTVGKTRYIVPASFPEKDYQRYQRVALKTHHALGARDFSRIDMMIDEKGKEYVLELNSIPGFTETSLLPKAAKKEGFSFGDLCQEILTLAVRRTNGSQKKTKKKS
jgi:D-alanine-D-alanine ligase